MAPYISSHLRDRVWLVPPCQGTQLDILQNLVANTRPQQSAMACLSAPVPLPCSGRSRPAGRKTSVRQGQRAVVDSGWSPMWDGRSGRVVWPPGPQESLDHTNF